VFVLLNCADLLPSRELDVFLLAREFHFRKNSAMAKLAYLGPQWTFSHELARQAFPKDEHIPQNSLKAVVECIANDVCSVGLIPFYNTTRLSIEESQIELVQHGGKVFVTDVLPLEVRHHVGGFGTLADVRELRSKTVVFHQISKWLTRRKFEKIPQTGYPSTSAAVKSLCDGVQRKESIAVGTISAFQKYEVPVLEKNIHNKPNHTLFFTIQNKRPDLSGVNRIVMCLRKPASGDRDKVESIITQCGCGISSNWSVTLKLKPVEMAYFFEINGTYSSLGLTSAVKRLTSELKNTFVLGGYSDKCITKLLWAQNQ
jgi:prephenate dehydratase